MFQKAEFKIALIRRGITSKELAKALGINPSTLNRKMNGITEFCRNEIETIRIFLGLTQEETINIFFA